MNYIGRMVAKAARKVADYFPDETEKVSENEDLARLVGKEVVNCLESCGTFKNFVNMLKSNKNFGDDSVKMVYRNTVCAALLNLDPITYVNSVKRRLEIFDSFGDGAVFMAPEIIGEVSTEVLDEMINNHRGPYFRGQLPSECGHYYPDVLRVEDVELDGGRVRIEECKYCGTYERKLDFAPVLQTKDNSVKVEDGR